MNSRTSRKTERQMYLLVSGDHICDPQRDINMASPYKALKNGWNVFPNISHMNYRTDLILGKDFRLFIFFHFPDSNFLYWLVCNFIFDGVTVKTQNCICYWLQRTATRTNCWNQPALWILTLICIYVYGYVFYELTPMLMSINVNSDVTTNPYTLGMSLNSVMGRPNTLVKDYEDKFFLNWTLNFKGPNNGMWTLLSYFSFDEVVWFWIPFPFPFSFPESGFWIPCLRVARS